MNAMMKLMTACLVLAGLIFSGTLLAAGSDTAPAGSKRNPDLIAGKAAIEDHDWQKAIDRLSLAMASEPDNADIRNYLGYASRKSGNLEDAFTHYNEALKLEPEHRGAHEYIGEAYLMAGNPAKAEEHLAALGRICRASCYEYLDLKKAVANYKEKK